jgi:tetratricopeptide (TPR) repeat protein/uncharacterized membrane protein YqjE
MVGLLFGVHPMTVETIPWIGERKTLLAAFFALWCLIVYVRYARRPDWKLWVTCLVFYVLALMSKPISTPLPVVLLLLDFWPLNRLNKRAVIEKLPFLAIGVAFSMITVVSQARTTSVEYPNEYSPGRIPLVLCHNIVFYLCKIVWPAHLSSHYPFPRPLALSAPMVLAGVIGTCILIPGLLISLRWTRALLTGWLIFLVAIFPTMGVLKFTVVIASDKYAYLPAVGLLLILGWALERVWTTGTERERRVRQVGTVTVVAVAASLLVTGTRSYLSHWQTTVALCDYMLNLAPDAYLVYNNRGYAYKNKGDYVQAIRDYTKAIELKPDYALAHSNRGNVYFMKHDFGRAIHDYTRAIELQPDFAKAYYNRGVAYQGKGDYNQAIRDYTRAVDLKSDYADAYNNRGIAYADQRAYVQAIRDYTKAIEIRPDYADAYYNRGCDRNAKGDHDQAILDYSRAIELKPGYIQAYKNRAITNFSLKQYDKAWADVKMCMHLGGTPQPAFVRALTEATGRTE